MQEAWALHCRSWPRPQRRTSARSRWPTSSTTCAPGSRLSEQDVARATGAEEATVREWIERKAVPMGVQANRLAELIAVVEEMALNIEPDGISGMAAAARFRRSTASRPRT